MNNCDGNAVFENIGVSVKYECNNRYENNGVVWTKIDEFSTGDINCDLNADCSYNDGRLLCAFKATYAANGIACANIDKCTPDSDDYNDAVSCLKPPAWIFTCLNDSLAII